MVIRAERRRLTTVMLFMFLLAGCATVSPVRLLEDEALLQNLCKRYGIDLHLDGISQVVTLNADGAKAKALVESSMVIIGDEKILLEGPLKRQQGAIVVPPDFEEKVIQRLISREDYAIKKLTQVMIDPGHGGRDPGAIGRSGLKEKNVVLDIAKRLKVRFEEYGMKVAMTRETDEFISLEERAAMAGRSNADLFISIHANASRSHSAQGFEVYFLKDTSDLVRGDGPVVKKNRQIFNRFAVKQDPILEGILLDLMYIHKQAESRRLAQYLTRDMIPGAATKMRGMKPSGFFVLKNTLIPSILVEVGFLSNSGEESLLNTDDYRQKIADSLARSILSYASQ